MGVLLVASKRGVGGASCIVTVRPSSHGVRAQDGKGGKAVIVDFFLFARYRAVIPLGVLLVCEERRRYAWGRKRGVEWSGLID